MRTPIGSPLANALPVVLQFLHDRQRQMLDRVLILRRREKRIVKFVIPQPLAGLELVVGNRQLIRGADDVREGVGDAGRRSDES